MQDFLIVHLCIYAFVVIHHMSAAHMDVDDLCLNVCDEIRHSAYCCTDLVYQIKIRKYYVFAIEPTLFLLKALHH